ncbi:PAS domain S-box protein [Planococcus sp. 1R117A]|uniref:PAS domain S-box protein n=1 Tax=Planococcus sp. 1R117A TaxID=3447020 RepID=UPI003EDC07A9
MMKHFPEKIGPAILASTALLDLLQDLVFLMEEDQGTFRYVYANPAAFANLHLQETVIGSRIEDVMSSAQAQFIIENYRKAQTRRKPVEFMQRIEAETGGRTGETILTPIVDDDGQCRYILAVVRDVTDRERKKRDLQKTQKEIEMEIERKRLNSLIANNGNAVFEFDQHKKFLSLNPMVTTVTGFSEQELLGQSVVSLVADSYVEETIANFEKALKGKPIEFETAIYTKKHELVLFHVNTIPIALEEKLIGIYAVAREITEQKKTERLLRESEQRYKSLFANHPHGIFTFDQYGNLESGNAGAEDITGYSMEELQEKSFMAIIVPHDIVKVKSHFFKAIKKKQPERLEMSIRHKKGHFIDLQAMNIPILVQGQVVGIYGIVINVTEINRAQKALTETKKELEVFWENSTDPIFYIDTKGDILKANPAFEETFGYSEEEMVTGKGTIIPQHLITAQFDIIDRILKGEVVNSHDTIRMTKSGKPLNIISSYSPVRNAGKEIIGATILYKNVTELKKAEQELQKSQEKYKRITESSFDIITLINLSGQIEYVSPANEKILGYPDQAYIGSPFTINVHPEDAFELMESVTSLIDGGKPSTIEVRFLHQKGHYIWMEVSPTPVLANGEVKQLFTIARDITERRRLQDKIAKMAFYDHLSGIPNRRTFDDKLQKAIQLANRSGKKVGVLMLDGRKFKQINDQYGHDAGDAVIQEMAKRLQASIRPVDTAARLGGDEMGVVLPEIDSIEMAEDTAKRILQSYETPLLFNGYEIRMGAGIGISLYPDDTPNVKQLIKYADLALYEAKKSDVDEYRIYSRLESL